MATTMTRTDIKNLASSAKAECRPAYTDKANYRALLKEFDVAQKAIGKLDYTERATASGKQLIAHREQLVNDFKALPFKSDLVQADQSKASWGRAARNIALFTGGITAAVAGIVANVIPFADVAHTYGHNFAPYRDQVIAFVELGAAALSFGVPAIFRNFVNYGKPDTKGGKIAEKVAVGLGFVATGALTIAVAPFEAVVVGAAILTGVALTAYAFLRNPLKRVNAAKSIENGTYAHD